MHNIATTRILYASETAAIGPAKPWICSLPRLDGINPSIIPTHGALADGLTQIGDPDRTSSPDFVPVFALQDGGAEHPGGWPTQYSELEHVLALSTDRSRRRRKVRVRAGAGGGARMVRASAQNLPRSRGAWRGTATAPRQE
jgi:hypothetical protein